MGIGSWTDEDEVDPELEEQIAALLANIRKLTRSHRAAGFSPDEVRSRMAVMCEQSEGSEVMDRLMAEVEAGIWEDASEYDPIFVQACRYLYHVDAWPAGLLEAARR